jgi:hypothetical protein
MGKCDAQFIMILDIDRVFSAEDIAAAHGRVEAGWSGKEDHAAKSDSETSLVLDREPVLVQ